MLRWNDVEDQTIFGMAVKMYREPFIPEDTITSLYVGLEFDHYAYKYMGSELYMYRVLDTNFIEYIEERGDLDRVKDIVLPRGESFKETVL